MTGLDTIHAMQRVVGTKDDTDRIQPAHGVKRPSENNKRKNRSTKKYRGPMSPRRAAQNRARLQKNVKAVKHGVKNIGRAAVKTVKSLKDGRSLAAPSKNPQNEAMRKSLEANRKQGVVSNGVGVSYKRSMKYKKPGDMYNAMRKMQTSIPMRTPKKMPLRAGKMIKATATRPIRTDSNVRDLRAMKGMSGGRAVKRKMGKKC